MSGPKPSRDDEIATLRARVAELETELSRTQMRDRVDYLETELSRRQSSTRSASDYPERGTRRSNSRGNYLYDRDTVNRATDIYTRQLDEGNRLYRAWTHSWLEYLGLMSDTVSTFVDEVISRNQPDPNETPTDVARRLPADIYAGWVNAVDRTSDVRDRSVDRFYNSYKEVRPRRYSSEYGRNMPAALEPQVVATSPSDGSTVPLPAKISVTFNEPIQPAGADFSSSIFVKTGTTTIQGKAQLIGTDMLVWTPDSPLAAGNYSVTLFNVESSSDGRNQPMRTPYAFSFTIDILAAEPTT